jgi:Fic family protein
MRSLLPAFLDRLTFTAEQLATLRQLGEAQGRQELFTRQLPEVLKTLRQVASVESTESSNRLEGITVPHPRLEDLVLKASEPRDRSEQEIAGYRDALQLMHESAPEMFFRTSVILQVHAMLYRYVPATGGAWKATDNEIVDRAPSGEVVRVRFRAVPAVATPQAMEDLTGRFADTLASGRYDPLVLIPLAVLDLLCIHPFSDGNGRAARLVTLQLLYQSGYEVGRYISLERHFEQVKTSYYETLEASSQGWHEGQHDPHPWLNLFWGVLLAAHREFEQRVGTLGTGRGAKSARVRAAVGRRIQPFRISELERDCPGVGRDTIRQVLRQLRDDGKLRVEGQGRGARWVRV